MSDSLRPHGLYSPWNSSGQNTGVGSLSLHQGIFPTQRSNPGLLHGRRILYQLSLGPLNTGQSCCPVLSHTHTHTHTHVCIHALPHTCRHMRQPSHGTRTHSQSHTHTHTPRRQTLLVSLPTCPANTIPYHQPHSQPLRHCLRVFSRLESLREGKAGWRRALPMTEPLEGKHPSSLAHQLG